MHLWIQSAGGQAMTREDIIKLAREAGFQVLLPRDHVDGTGGVYVEDDDIAEMLERFAALVAAAEREECAKVCEAVPSSVGWYFAKAVRARGET